MRFNIDYNACADNGLARLIVWTGIPLHGERVLSLAISWDRRELDYTIDLVVKMPCLYDSHCFQALNETEFRLFSESIELD